MSDHGGTGRFEEPTTGVIVVPRFVVSRSRSPLRRRGAVRRRRGPVWRLARLLNRALSRWASRGVRTVAVMGAGLFTTRTARGFMTTTGGGWTGVWTWSNANGAAVEREGLRNGRWVGAAHLWVQIPVHLHAE